MSTTTPFGIIPTHAAATALPANPTTPPFTNDQQWITAYLTIHMMSSPSYRVTYLLWFTIAFFFIVASIMHCIGARNSFIGAHWSKWALRRRTWRKKHELALARKKGQSHRQPLSLPSNAQLLSLVCIFVVAMVLSFVGPDYIAPQVGVFDFVNDAPVSNIQHRETYDPSQFVQYQPQYTISKAWWTIGGRTGLIAFALFPLCVLLALKSAPFALFSMPFTAQFHFDKLSCIHRWTGRLIWFVTALHVAAWSVQLAKDSRQATNVNAYTYAWQYPKFIYGWIVRSVQIYCHISLNFYSGFRLSHVNNILFHPTPAAASLRGFLLSTYITGATYAHNECFPSSTCPVVGLGGFRRMGLRTALASCLVDEHQRLVRGNHRKRSSSDWLSPKNSEAPNPGHEKHQRLPASTTHYAFYADAHSVLLSIYLYYSR